MLLKNLIKFPTNVAIGVLSKNGYAAAAASTPHVEHSSSGGGSKELKFTFASPNKALYANTVVKQIDVPGMASTMGILPIHVPTIAVLKPGVLTVHETEGNVVKYFVSSGTVSMNIDGTCQILAEEIFAIEDLDAQAAKQMLDESNKRAIDPSASDVEKAEAQIQVEVAEAVGKAASGGQ